MRNPVAIVLVGLVILGASLVASNIIGAERDAANAREQQRELVHSQRRGCERSKLDRAANASGWRTAEHARRASGTPDDLMAARRYAQIATGLEDRARVDCTRQFPLPR